jgi:hypothetical protein
MRVLYSHPTNAAWAISITPMARLRFEFFRGAASLHRRAWSLDIALAFPGFSSKIRAGLPVAREKGGSGKAVDLRRNIVAKLFIA